MLKNAKVAVLIPCYNEEKTIGKVIRDFKIELPKTEIFVCDNNSTDNTSGIARANGAEVVYESRQGKTYAVLKLFRHIEADIYILVDGDDTYPANSIKVMLKLFLSENVDMLVGDRLSNGAYREQNKRKGHVLGNNLIRKAINKIYKTDLKDVLSGYRVFSKRYVKNYTTLVKGFELETDLSIFALNYELVIHETPIEYKSRPANSFSKLNTYKDGYSIFITILNLFKFYKPLPFFSGLGLLFLFLSLLIGSFPVFEFIKYNYVYKVPSVVLAGLLVSISLLLFICGIILDTIIKIDKKNILLQIRNTK